jgi:hypothetical protein
LFAAWKSKSFTSNDIMLHFYLLDILHSADRLSVEELTDAVYHKSEKLFEAQTVRHKCVEYAKEGILIAEKCGRKVTYGLSQLYYENIATESPLLSDAVKFFTEAAPLGVVGSFISDNEDMKNQVFSFKHHYIVHTLEDGILFNILSAIRKNVVIRIENVSEKTKKSTSVDAVPLKILVSSTTGRRYVCVYTLRRKRFACYRLDYVKSVSILDAYEDAENLRKKLENNLPMLWGVNFGGRARSEIISMKLFIDEKYEQYIIDRVNREGRGGSLSRVEANTFLYTKECYDVSEITPWLKTFTGRILSVESTNEEVVRRFYEDIKRMNNMYEGE